MREGHQTPTNRLAHFDEHELVQPRVHIRCSAAYVFVYIVGGANYALTGEDVNSGRDDRDRRSSPPSTVAELWVPVQR